MIYKRCSRCGKRILTGTKCDCIKDVRREYDKYYRNKKSAAFYASSTWKKVREATMQRYDGLDVYLYVTTGQVVKADVVHHIVPLTDDESKQYEETNLIPLSHGTHNMVHDTYGKGQEQMKEMQSRLADCLRRFG